MAQSTSRYVDECLRSAEEQGLLMFSAAGSLRCALDRRIAWGEVVRPLPGMYARAEWWRDRPWREQVMCKIRSYAALRPQCTFCSYTAAFLLGIQVPKATIMGPLHVMADCGNDTGLVTRHGITSCGVDHVDQLTVTSLERTAFDCMRALGFRNGLAVADSYLRLSGLDRADAAGTIDHRFRGHRGIRRVRSYLAHADGRSENGGESYVRAVMIEHGVQLPELQVVIPRPDNPRRSYRMDFFWELPGGVLIDGELDGFDKTEDEEMRDGRTRAEVLDAERTRGSLITSRGIRVVRFTFDMALKTYPLLERLDLYGIPRAGV